MYPSKLPIERKTYPPVKGNEDHIPNFGLSNSSIEALSKATTALVPADLMSELKNLPETKESE